MHNKRKRIWIDRFQTLLFFRIMGYVIIYMAILSVFFVFWNWFSQFGSGIMRPLAWGDFIPALFGSLLLLPALVWDATKFSHRLVGPLVRFRRAMQDIAAGEEIDPIKLRDGDFLMELKDDFNEMLAALKEARYFDEEKRTSDIGSEEMINV